MLKLTRKRRGYSLVEIMIVVMIIGALTAMMLPKVKNLLRKITDMKENRILQSWNSKIMEYYLDTGVYPEKLDNLYIKPSNSRIAANWRGYTEDANDLPLDSKQKDLVYNRPPVIFKDIYKNYEMYVVGDIDPDDATENNITAKIGS